jgi:hypothetical protein
VSRASLRQAGKRVEVSANERFLLDPRPALDLALGGDGFLDALEVSGIDEGKGRRLAVYPPKVPWLCWLTRVSRSSARLVPT